MCVDEDKEPDNVTTSMRPSSENKTPCYNKMGWCLKKNLLMVFTLTGIILGFIIGFTTRLTNPSDLIILWIGKSK